MDDVWGLSQQLIALSAPLSNLFSRLASLWPLHLSTHCRSPACPCNWSLLLLFFLCLVHFFVVPSFLPFQKVMHTRKRHSELYHELNHSSKFHTIDRYSRDPAMSTFKVRPLPQKLRDCGTICGLAPLSPPFTTTPSNLKIAACLLLHLFTGMLKPNTHSVIYCRHYAALTHYWKKSQTKRTIPVD